MCQPGRTGQFCDQNIGDCVDKCKNGGTCHDLLDDFYCTCPIGFEGRYCEINRECSSKPCQNKGIGHEITGGYLCECPNGFIGQNCELTIDLCQANPRQNGEYCQHTLYPGDIQCHCPLGWSGR
uniref:EGF-like domain-containing protein n=1 Tax=Schistosoma mansoni TaxID=6183 RepID=A0A5K4F6D5_SCHMA